MRDQTLSFLGPDVFAKASANRGNKQRVFDFDKAAVIIREKLKECPGLVAEAGLEGDWSYTGGVIFMNGKHFSDEYTFLSSTWAVPTMILITDGEEVSMPCWHYESECRFTSGSKWDETSIAILNSKP